MASNLHDSEEEGGIHQWRRCLDSRLGEIREDALINGQTIYSFHLKLFFLYEVNECQIIHHHRVRVAQHNQSGAVVDKLPSSGQCGAA